MDLDELGVFSPPVKVKDVFQTKKSAAVRKERELAGSLKKPGVLEDLVSSKGRKRVVLSAGEYYCKTEFGGKPVYINEIAKNNKNNVMGPISKENVPVFFEMFADLLESEKIDDQLKNIVDENIKRGEKIAETRKKKL